MGKAGIIERFRIWRNVYGRVRFFKKMYPLSSVAKDIFLLPFDYAFNPSFIRRVRNVTIAVTHRCNVRCQMCYFHKELKGEGDLPLALYKRIIDSVRKTSPCIILTGGEPFMHPDLINMVEYAKKSGLAVQVFTNGTLLTPDLTDSLIRAGLDYINFTLLGNEKSHSEIARSPGAYEKFIKNLEYFASRRNGTQVILNFTVTPEAIGDITHAADLAGRYKLDGLRIQHYNFLLPVEFKAQDRIIKNIFGMDSNTHEIEKMPEEISGMAGRLTEFKEYLSKNIPEIPVQWAPDLTDSEIKDWYSGKDFKTRRKCFYPWRGIFIDPAGCAYPCSKIYLKLGNTNEEEVLTAWNSLTMNKFRASLKKGLFPACARCCKL